MALDSVFDIVALAGSLVLVLMLVALAGVAYKGLVGDGIEWPDEDEGEDELRQGDSDEDWKYY